MKEDIVNPKRYTRNQLECWDFWMYVRLNPIIASSVKYVWRYKDKNGMQDLDKAGVFLDKASLYDPYELDLSESNFELEQSDVESFNYLQYMFMLNAILSTHPQFYNLAIKNMRFILAELKQEVERDTE